MTDDRFLELVQRARELRSAYFVTWRSLAYRLADAVERLAMDLKQARGHGEGVSSRLASCDRRVTELELELAKAQNKAKRAMGDTRLRDLECRVNHLQGKDCEICR